MENVEEIDKLKVVLEFVLFKFFGVEKNLENKELLMKEFVRLLEEIRDELV